MIIKYKYICEANKGLKIWKIQNPAVDKVFQGFPLTDCLGLMIEGQMGDGHHHRRGEDENI